MMKLMVNGAEKSIVLEGLGCINLGVTIEIVMRNSEEVVVSTGEEARVDGEEESDDSSYVRNHGMGCFPISSCVGWRSPHGHETTKEVVQRNSESQFLVNGVCFVRDW